MKKIIYRRYCLKSVIIKQLKIQKGD